MNSYKSIIQTTGIVGSTKILTLLFNFLKGKLIAVLLGPSGMGIFALLQSIGNLGVTFSDLGLKHSAVLYLAKENDSKNENSAIVSLKIILIMATIFATIISLTVILISKKISMIAFGNDSHSMAICLISGFIFTTTISQIIISGLNGMRDIKLMAICQILSSIVGGVSSCIGIIIWGEKGIALAFLLMGISSFFITIAAVHKLLLTKTFINLSMFLSKFKQILMIGIAILSGDVFFHLFSYFSKIYINNNLGIEKVGLYQACWAISNLYIGMILSAMGADFLPRIMGYASDKQKMCRSINEQIELGLVFSLPGVVLTMIFAPHILRLLYSKAFESAAFIIRWQIVGIVLRIMAWPLSYAIIACNKKNLFALMQGIFYITQYVLLIVCVKIGGINGLGPQFVFAYLVYLFGMALFCYHELNYIPSQKTMKLLSYITGFVIIVIGTVLYIENTIMLTSIGFIISIMSIMTTYMLLKKMFNIDIKSIVRTKVAKYVRY